MYIECTHICHTFSYQLYSPVYLSFSLNSITIPYHPLCMHLSHRNYVQSSMPLTLGYIVSSEGISMDLERISTITEWLVPESVYDVQVFLSLVNYYQRFIEGYSCIVLPLTNLL